jgi:hypothetical protein
MENITATFSNWTEMETAAEMLREQGVVDIKLLSNKQDPDEAAVSIGPDITNSVEPSNQGYMIQVMVESSRYRLAEDTIARFGGYSEE